MFFQFEMIMLSAVSILCILLRWVFLRRQFRQWKFPPGGPDGLPIFGSFLSLVISRSPHLKFSEWEDTYKNGLYSVNILTRKVVVVSCPTAMRRFFEHPESSRKFKAEPIHFLAGRATSTDVGQQEGRRRNFCVRTLRECRLWKRNVIQIRILFEAEETVKRIRRTAYCNDDIIESPINLLRTATYDTLWKIIRGDQLPIDYTRWKRVTQEFADALITSEKKGLAIFPWLKWLAPKRSGYEKLVKSFANLRRLIREQFSEHEIRRNQIGRQEPNDLVDAYMDHTARNIDSANNSTSHFYEGEECKHGTAIIAEMLAREGESTPHILNWLLLYLANRQDIQIRVHNEIDKVLGTENPQLHDKSRMPYTEAVLLETLRKCSPFPWTTVYRVNEDGDFPNNLKLPKGTLLISNMYHAHMSKHIWYDPECFRPERFLSEFDQEDVLVPERRPFVIAFNAGMETCSDEPLAMDILFLFAVKIFQAFRILPYPGNAKPDYNSSVPGMMMAKPYSIVIRERQRGGWSYI